jgi:NitT/TauT family transport system permease protein
LGRAGVAVAPLEIRRRSHRRARLWRTARDVVQPTLFFVLLLVLWEAAVRVFRIPVYLLPAPSVIWVDTTRIAAAVSGHTLATLQTIVIGFLVSIAVSLPLAIVITYSRLFANAVYPFLVVTQSIPKVALAPILVVALGANELPRVVVTFLVAFFPLVISIAAGLMSVPPDLLELGRSYKATRAQELTRIRLPYAVPFIFSGLKVAITLSVVGAVVGEFVAANRGLGYLITSSTAFFKTPVAFGAMILLSIMGIVLFQALVIVERVFFPWSATASEPNPSL